MTESDEDRAREDEMSKLRSSSSSPSTISTASSGSPLVRNLSGSSQQHTRRPAPTSIAAAQLQCQQQFEFTNRLATSAGNNSNNKMPKGSNWPIMMTKNDNNNSSSSSSSSSGKVDDNFNKALKASQRHDARKKSKLEKALASSKNSKLFQQKHQQEDNERGKKSVGYKMAKSIAFRAYRFNEFWTVNKMRYMNFACLLMTLVCLITILIFSNSSGTTTTPTTTTRAEKRAHKLGPLMGKPFRDPQVAHNQAGETKKEAESMDYLDSQPLVSSGGDSFDDVNLVENKRTPFLDQQSGRKFRRKSEISNGPSGDVLPVDGAPNQPPTGTTEREMEDSTTATSAPSSVDQTNDKQTDLLDPSVNSSNFIDPILSQIFGESELTKAMKKATLASEINSSTSGNSITRKTKPVITVSKDGLTLSFSSTTYWRPSNASSSINDTSSSANETSTSSSDSPFPSLLEKLLTPILRPISLSGGRSGTDLNASASGRGSGSSEPMLLAGGSLSRLGAPFDPFGLPEAMPALGFLGHHPHHHPHSHHHHHHGHHSTRHMNPGAKLIITGEGPMGMGSSFSSPHATLFGPPSGALMPMMPPPGLLRMLMRGIGGVDPPTLNNDDDDDETEPAPSGSFSRPPAAGVGSGSVTMVSSANSTTSGEQSVSNNKTEPLSAQASQQSSSNNNNNNATNINKTNTTLGSLDAEVETIDVSHLAKPSSPPKESHNFYFPHKVHRIKPAGGSMLIFSSANLDGSNPLMRDPFQFPLGGPSGSILSPFMSASSGAPQMMVIREEEPAGMSMMRLGGPLNPILRSIFGNVLSDVAPPSSGSKRRSWLEPDSKPWSSSGKDRRFSTLIGYPSRIGSDNEESDSSHIQTSSPDGDANWRGDGKQLSARHRTVSGLHSNDDEDVESSEHEFINSQAGPNHHQSVDSHSSSNLFKGQQQSENSMNDQTGGTIRQTFRGPGMTVERIIEVPTSNRNVNQQVGAGIKSQSLSREPAASSSSPLISSSPFEFGNQDNSIEPSSPSSAGAGRSFLNPFGRAFVSPANSQERADTPSTALDFIGPHVGFIGRMLLDMTRRAEARKDSAEKYRGRSLFGTNSMTDQDDFDEGESLGGDSMISLPPVASKTPKIRVSTSRMRMRSHDNHQPSGSFAVGSPFMAPSHFTIGDNFLDSDKSESEPTDAPSGGLYPELGEHNKLSSSFDDAMSSMEDRLDQVLSIVGSKQPDRNPPMKRVADEDGGGQKTSNSAPHVHLQESDTKQMGQQQQQVVGQATEGAPDSAPVVIVGSGHQQQRPTANNRADANIQNPFTSPSSPLFGFPTSSLTTATHHQHNQHQHQAQRQPLPALSSNDNQNQSQNEQLEAKQPVESNNNNNRQQRSFTYHSNNQLASSLVPPANQQHQQRNQPASPQLHMATGESMNRPKFIPLSSVSSMLPPARIVMGRRLDDQPTLGGNEQESPASNNFNQQPSAPSLMIGRAFKPTPVE